MHLIGMTIHNGCQHTDLGITFSPGLTVIKGPNGSGKTNMLRILAYGITGMVDPIWGSQADIQSNNTDDVGYVELKILHGINPSTVLTIRRHFSNEAKYKDILTGTAEPIIGRKKVNEFIELMLGLPITLVFRFIWSRQGELAWLLSADTNSMYSFFAQLYGLEKFEKLRKDLQDMQSAIPVIQVPESFSQKQAVIDYTNMLKQISDLEKDIAIALDAKTKATAVYAEAKQNVGKITVSQKAAKIAEYNKSIKLYELEIEKIKGECSTEEAEIAKLLKSVDDVKVKIAELTELKKQIADIEEQLMKNQDILRNMNNNSLTISDMQHNVCELCGAHIENTAGYTVAKKNMVAALYADTVKMLELLNETLMEKISVLKMKHDVMILQKNDSVLKDLNAKIAWHESNRNRISNGERNASSMLTATTEKLSALENIEPIADGAITEYQAQELFESTDTIYTEFVAKKARLEAEAAQFKIQSATNINLLKLSKKHEDARDRLINIRRGYHKDNIPATLMQSKLKRLSTMLEEMCSVYNLPFALRITSDRQFIFEKPGIKASIDKLSGGELSLASGCLQIALAEITSIDTGIYMFDEPSVFLTSDNIGILASMFENLSANAVMRGSVILLPTHEEEFEGCCTERIQL